MSSLPDWMHPPRPEGWVADDLDKLPEAPRHTELLDGALVFMMSPQTSAHSRIVTALTVALAQRAPAGIGVEREVTVRLDRYNRPEPDVLVTTAAFLPDRTWFDPGDVVLVVEVESPESAHRDRVVKLGKYAQAGIGHYWRVEHNDGRLTVHVYEMDEPTQRYAPAGIFRDRLVRTVPYAIDLDLTTLI